MLLSDENACSLWQCPLCQQALQIISVNKQYRCANNHCFDIAKEGYINLIPVNKKNSKNPGDSKAMIRARRLFLAVGYYQNLADQLAELTLKYAKHSRARILEVGCGEGYYLRELEKHAVSYGQAVQCGHQFYGLDISKEAIKVAAKLSKSQCYSVASSFSMPVEDASMDIVIRNFAPAPSVEIQRVLKPEGIYIVVTPGPKHLFQLRQQIYHNATEHDVTITAVENFELLEQVSLSNNINIDQPEHVSALLQMTPYYWQASKQDQAVLDDLAQLSCDTEFVVSVYRQVL